MHNLTSFHVSEQVRLKAKGLLSLYACEDVETLSFNPEAPLFTGNNVLTNNFINFIGKLEEVPVVLAIGNGDKIPSRNELINKDIVRKSIVALKDISTGDIFSETNLTSKRPGSGISPMNWEDIIGKVSKRNFKKDEIIDL